MKQLVFNKVNNKMFIFICMFLVVASVAMAGNTTDVLSLSNTWATLKSLLEDFYVQSIIAFWLAWKAFGQFSQDQPNQRMGIFFVILAFFINDFSGFVEKIASSAILL